MRVFFPKTSITLAILALLSAPLHALELPINTEEDKPKKVIVINEDPISVRSAGSKLIQIVHEIDLDKNQTYDSPYFDVQNYKSITVFVQSETILASSDSPPRYQLDAFFSPFPSKTEYKKLGQNKAEVMEAGFQEFGRLVIDKGSRLESFELLSTGDTASRSLHTPVYGPYVRFTLKNTSGPMKKFKVYAFASA